MTAEEAKEKATAFLKQNAEQAKVVDEPRQDEPLRSYTLEADGKKTRKIPRAQSEIVDEVHRRFNGQPYVVTSSFSLHDGEDEMSEEKDLFFFHNGRTKVLHGRNAGTQLLEVLRKNINVVDFPRGTEFVGIDNLLEALKDRDYAKHVYKTISHTPTWPGRKDAFETLKRSDLPPPSPNHEAFRNFCAMFLPATPADATLIKAFVMAPAFFHESARSPGWLVKTRQAQSAGKTELVKGIAKLWDEVPLEILQKSLDNDDEEISKRLLSTEGMRKRFVIFDNQRHVFSNEKVASMVTSNFISGRKLNVGEGGRPNDVIFTVTANDATLAADMTSRFYTITVRQPDEGADNLINEKTGERETWEQKRDRYIEDNRLQVLADIFDRIENAPFRERPHRDGMLRNRFNLFDQRILSGACDTDDEFLAADAAIVEAGLHNNAERQIADEFMQLLEELFQRCAGYVANVPVVFEYDSFKEFCMASGNTFYKGKTWEFFSRLIENGTLTNFAKNFRYLPDRRVRSFFYGIDRQPKEELLTPYQFLKYTETGVKIDHLGNTNRR